MLGNAICCYAVHTVLNTAMPNNAQHCIWLNTTGTAMPMQTLISKPTQTLRLADMLTGMIANGSMMLCKMFSSWFSWSSL